MCVCCESANNAGVVACMGDIPGSGVLSSAGDVLEMSVVRGVGGVGDMCMCLAWGGRCWGRQDWVWSFPILEEHGVSGICVCVLVVVVLGESGWAAWARVLEV